METASGVSKGEGDLRQRVPKQPKDAIEEAEVATNPARDQGVGEDRLPKKTYGRTPNGTGKLFQ